MRGDEHTLFLDDVENLEDTISATDKAIQVMQEEQASSTLIQKAAVQGSPEDLLKLDPSKGNPFKPKAKTFSAHQGGVIETFKRLEEDWASDKLSEEEQETNAINAYNLAKQARDSAISTAEASKSEKEGIKADRETEKAKAESDKDEQEKMLEGDLASLDTTDQSCKTKTQEWEERSKIRSGELEAMAVAKKILSKIRSGELE